MSYAIRDAKSGRFFADVKGEPAFTQTYVKLFSTQKEAETERDGTAVFTDAQPDVKRSDLEIVRIRTEKVA